MKLEILSTDFRINWNKIFNENPSNGGGVPWRSTLSLFRNFVKLSKNTTAHTTICRRWHQLKASVSWTSSWSLNFTLPKFKSFLFWVSRLQLNFMLHFLKSFQTFLNKFVDECTAISWWHLKVAHSQKNISIAVWYKEKTANVVSNRGKKYCFFSLVLNDRRTRSFSITFTDLHGHILPDVRSAK